MKPATERLRRTGRAWRRVFLAAKLQMALWPAVRAGAEKASGQFNGFLVGFQECPAVWAGAQMGCEGGAVRLAESVRQIIADHCDFVSTGRDGGPSAGFFSGSILNHACILRCGRESLPDGWELGRLGRRNPQFNGKPTLGPCRAAPTQVAAPQRARRFAAG